MPAFSAGGGTAEPIGNAADFRRAATIRLCRSGNAVAETLTRTVVVSSFGGLSLPLRIRLTTLTARFIRRTAVRGKNEDITSGLIKNLLDAYLSNVQAMSKPFFI